MNTDLNKNTNIENSGIRFGPSGNSASFYAEGHKGTLETAA